MANPARTHESQPLQHWTCCGADPLYLESHWVLLVIDPFTRRITGFGVHPGEVSIALCRMFNMALSGQGAPHYLSSDNDPLFQYHRWPKSCCRRQLLELNRIRCRFSTLL